jgi:hypothetical protein
MLKVAEGVDPQAERMSERGRGTFEELATRYVNEFAKKRNKSWKQADALVRKYILPTWGKLHAPDIKRADSNGFLRVSTTPLPSRTKCSLRRA